MPLKSTERLPALNTARLKSKSVDGYGSVSQPVGMGSNLGSSNGSNSTNSTSGVRSIPKYSSRNSANVQKSSPIVNSKNSKNPAPFDKKSKPARNRPASSLQLKAKCDIPDDFTASLQSKLSLLAKENSESASDKRQSSGTLTSLLPKFDQSNATATYPPPPQNIKSISTKRNSVTLGILTSRMRSSSKSTLVKTPLSAEITYFMNRDYRNDPLWQLIGKETSSEDDSPNLDPEITLGNDIIDTLPYSTQTENPAKSSADNATDKWTKLFRAQRLRLRLCKAYTKHALNASNMMRDTVSKGLTVKNIKNPLHFQPDPFIVDKVKKLLTIPPPDRTEHDMKQLERLLSVEIPDFAKFPSKEKLSFCQLMTMESYDTGKLLFRENHRPSCFYFILSGEIEIFKLSNGLNYVGAGKIIGHRIFDHGNVRRTACAATSMPSILLYINKGAQLANLDNYSLVMDRNKVKNSSIIYEKLHKTPLFEHQEEFLKSILPFFKMYSFSRNQVIQEEGKQALEFYFILEGTCRVTQRVPMSKNNTKSKPKDDGSETMVPVETLRLTMGDSFPPIPDLYPDGSMKYLGPTVIDTNLYVEFYTQLKINDSRTFSKASVQCEFDVSVAAIQFSDFFRLAPKEVVFSLVVEPSVMIFTVEEVQKQFEIAYKWKWYRKSIIAEYQD